MSVVLISIMVMFFTLVILYFDSQVPDTVLSHTAAEHRMSSWVQAEHDAHLANVQPHVDAAGARVPPAPTMLVDARDRSFDFLTTARAPGTLAAGPAAPAPLALLSRSRHCRPFEPAMAFSGARPGVAADRNLVGFASGFEAGLVDKSGPWTAFPNSLPLAGDPPYFLPPCHDVVLSRARLPGAVESGSASTGPDPLLRTGHEVIVPVPPPPPVARYADFPSPITRLHDIDVGFALVDPAAVPSLTNTLGFRHGEVVSVGPYARFDQLVCPQPVPVPGPADPRIAGGCAAASVVYAYDDSLPDPFSSSPATDPMWGHPHRNQGIRPAQTNPGAEVLIDYSIGTARWDGACPLPASLADDPRLVSDLCTRYLP